VEAINKRPQSTFVYPRTGIPLTPFRSQAKLVETIRWTVPAPIPPIATSFRSPSPGGRNREPDGPLEVNLAHHRRGCIRSQPRPGSAITAGRVPALTGLTQSRRDSRSRPAAIPDKTTRSTQLRSRSSPPPITRRSVCSRRHARARQATALAQHKAADVTTSPTIGASRAKQEPPRNDFTAASG